MSRNLPAVVEAAARASVVRVVWMVRLDYPGGVVAACSAPFPIVYGADTYHGVGNLGTIAPAEEGAELQAYSLTVTLSGVKPESIAAALGQAYQGRDARIYAAFLDAEHAIVEAPVLLFRGRMDVQDIELGSEATISVTIVSRLVDWDRARIRRYTHEDQQSAFPGDKGFEFVPTMEDLTIIWGRS